MKALLRLLFSPVLKPLESGEGSYTYKASHRTIAIAVGGLFTALASVVLWLAWGKDPGYLLPVVLFGGAGILSLVVGLVGSDRAVAKLWGGGRR